MAFLPARTELCENEKFQDPTYIPCALCSYKFHDWERTNYLWSLIIIFLRLSRNNKRVVNSQWTIEYKWDEGLPSSACTTSRNRPWRSGGRFTSRRDEDQKGRKFTRLVWNSWEPGARVRVLRVLSGSGKDAECGTTRQRDMRNR